jgi:predicted ATPase
VEILITMTGENQRAGQSVQNTAASPRSRMRKLEKITIKGFKSIRDQTLKLDRLNVFIGGNGVGKSNLIGTFRFLHEVIHQRLAKYAATRGGADSILHFGRKTTPKMKFQLEFGEAEFSNAYRLEIEGTADSGLIVSKEFAYYRDRVRPADRDRIETKATYRHEPEFRNELGLDQIAPYSGESRLLDDRSQHAVQICRDLNGCLAYHFHDTSDTAAMKGIGDLDDNRELRPQAENLAAFLYYLQEKQPDSFALIEDTIRQIAPFFGGFRLAPSRLNESKIRLEWRDKGGDGYFNATALSDGTLRFICLATLFLQPDLPTVIVLDEPELGLHPAAVTLLADLMGAASERSQVLVATQSVTLINQLTPEQVWTVNREDDQSVFRRLGAADLASWLDDYSLGELWEKNLIQARP